MNNFVLKQIKNFTYFILIFPITSFALSVNPIEIEGGRIYLNNTYNNPTWNHIEFKLNFSSIPEVFVVLDSNGTNPATVRIKNKTISGFDAMIVEPQGEDGPHNSQSISYLAVNKGIHKLGNHYIEVDSLQTKKVQGLYAPDGNIKGWRLIDSNISNPAVVANIQTLNNLDSNIPNDPIIPWGTAVVENNESGIYLSIDMSETSKGVFDKNETIGYMIADSNITDSFTDNNGKVVRYEVIKTSPYFVGWDDECKTVDFLNSYSQTPIVAGWKDSRAGDNGGWFRICHLDNKKIGFVVDEDRAHDSERHHIEEIGAIFAFSENFVFNSAAKNRTYKFDAWDTFRSINDRNISTKIANKDFNLTIASLDENGTNFQDFNGTVCALVGNNIKKLFFTNQSSKTVSFKIGKAIKNVRVHMAWKKDTNANCPLVEENNSTVSTDDFAIRPKRFVLSAAPPYYAGDSFGISYGALDELGNDTNDYNETLNSSFVVESNIIKKGCFQGTLNVLNFSFTNGVAKDINTTYSNLGDINITIKEKNGSEFAKVDKKDTNDSQRLISPCTVAITVKPYELNVTDISYINSTGKSWLYDAKVSDMNVTIYSTIKAFAKNSSLSLVDFNSTCYAKDVNISFSFDTNYSDSNISLEYAGIDGNLHHQNSIDKINQTYISIPSNSFIKGEANASYAYNIKRVYNRAVNPVLIKLKDVNITTSNISKLTHDGVQNLLINSDQNSTFYYGKLYTNDIETYEQNITSTLYVDIYCTNCPNGLNGFFQDSLNWYRNGYDNGVTFGGNISFYPKENVLFSSPNKSNIDINNISNTNNGKITFDISNSLNKYNMAIIHLNIPTWLWHNSYKGYNISNTSDCSTHPCINYKLIKVEGQNSIKSGLFKGADIGHEQNSTIKKVGVKVYR